MVLSKIKNYAGIAGKIYSLGNLLYKTFFKNEQDANKVYRAIQPSLQLNFSKYGRDSEEFNNLLEVLVKLTPIGAKRLNFERKFVTNKQSWRQLPRDPNNIMFGYWW